MANNILKSRHAFGSEKDIEKALQSGAVDAYDILFLDEGKIGWIDGEGNTIIVNGPEGGVTEIVVDKKIDVAIEEAAGYTDSKIEGALDAIENAFGDIESGAQVNDIETISLGGVELDIIDKAVNVPIGAGLKESEEVLIDEDGTLSVGKIGFDNLVQNEGEIVIFDGGSSAE